MYQLGLVQMKGCMCLSIIMAILPLLVPIIEDFKVGSKFISIIQSLTSFLTAFSSLIWGSLSDNHGRKVCCFIILIISSIGSIGCYFSNNIETFILFRIIQVFGCSGGPNIGMGIISDIYSKKYRY